jgi:hypothetical protein
LLERSNAPPAPPLAAAPAPSAQAPDELAEARARIAKLKAANARLKRDFDESQEKVYEVITKLRREAFLHAQAKKSHAETVSKLESKVTELRASVNDLQAQVGTQAARAPIAFDYDKRVATQTLADELIRRANDLGGKSIGVTPDAWKIPQLYLNVENMPQWKKAGISDRFHMSLHMAGRPNSWHFADDDRSGQLATYRRVPPPAVWHFSTTTAPDYEVAGLDYEVEHSKLLTVLDGIDTKDTAVYTQDRSAKLRMTMPELQAMLVLLTDEGRDLVELAVTAGIRLQPARVPLVF